MTDNLRVGRISFGPVESCERKNENRGIVEPKQGKNIATPPNVDARVKALEKELAEVTAIVKGRLAGDGSPTEADWKPIETLPKDRRYVEVRQRYETTSDGKDTILRPTHWRVAKP